MWYCASARQATFYNYGDVENLCMPVTDKKKFDELLKRMLQAKPTPVEKIKIAKKKPLKIIPAR